MKRKIKLIIGFILMVVIINFVVFAISFSIYSLLLDNAVIVLNTTSLLAVVIFPAIVSLIVTIVVFCSFYHKNKLLSFINKNFVSFFGIAVLACIFAIALMNVKNANLELSNTLLGVEWTIFGISTAIFLYRIQKEEETFELISSIDPDLLYGMKRFEQIQRIDSFRRTFSDSRITFVYIVINLISILLFTGSLFILDKEVYKQFVASMFTISLFFTTNTLIQILSDILVGYLNKKRNTFNKKYLNHDYDIKNEADKCELEERTVSSLLNKAKNDEDRKRIIRSFIESRKKEN